MDSSLVKQLSEDRRMMGLENRPVSASPLDLFKEQLLNFSYSLNTFYFMW